ncbi:TPA: 60S ribosomal protein L24 [Trebouxia sp. C0006]
MGAAPRNPEALSCPDYEAASISLLALSRASEARNRRTSTCRFSGLRIYPGRGIIFVRVDGQDLDTVVARKKRRSVNKTNVRPIGNASIEVLQKRRAEKPEQRKASREAALREVKERMKKTKADKQAQKSAQPKGGAKATKVMPKAGPKGAKR